MYMMMCVQWCWMVDVVVLALALALALVSAKGFAERDVGGERRWRKRLRRSGTLTLRRLVLTLRGGERE